VTEENTDWSKQIRSASPADLEYVLSTWISSYRNSPWAGTIPNNLFDSVCTETFNQLLLRGMQVAVCSNPANPEQLLGWLAYEREGGLGSALCVHHAFTKPLFRRLGIISQLLATVGAEGPFFYTHRTVSSQYLKHGIYRPEIARRKDFGKAKAA
jgi:hypothetical protein